MQAATLLRAYPTPSDGTILVALSGGADSVALLLALCEIGADVVAAHVNHMLRGAESDRDEAFCRALCERLGVPLTVARRDVNSERERGESLEDAARRIRYAELLAAAKRFGASLVATAHTANDNAETVLLNLARGSGTAGLAGIPPTRPLGDGVAVVRPLLAATRAEVEAFLAERGQDYVTDSTNLTADYTRNLIRREVLPPLLRANARAVEHLCAAAEQARQDEAYLIDEAKSLLRLAISRPTEGVVSLTLHHALDYPQPVLSRALRLAYAELSSATLTRAHTAALLELCRSADPSARLDLPSGITARRVYDTLILETSASPEAFTVRFTPATARRTSGGFSLEKPVYLDPSRTYHVRTRRIGDTFATEKWTKTLKKLMIDLKIPAHLRDTLPVIVTDLDSSEIAALPGFAAAKGFAAAIGEPALQIKLD